MNPANLFFLTPEQRRSYQLQPDDLSGYIWDSSSDEIERPPSMYETNLRFWYNTQSDSYGSHWHNETELIVPLKEGYIVTVQNRDWQLTPGDIFLIPPGSLHSLAAPPSGERFIFLYETDPITRLTSFSYARRFFSEPVLINAQTCPGIYEKEISLILEMAAHYWGKSEMKQMLVYASLLNLYAVYADYCLEGKPAASLSAASACSLSRSIEQKLDACLQYMEQNYALRLSLEDAAQMTGLSRFYFTRVFKQHTGQTFSEYLNRLRIRAAEKMLPDVSLPISRIAEDCGFESVSSFNRNFRVINGCTPTEYRNRSRSGRLAGR